MTNSISARRREKKRGRKSKWRQRRLASCQHVGNPEQLHEQLSRSFVSWFNFILSAEYLLNLFYYFIINLWAFVGNGTTLDNLTKFPALIVNIRFSHIFSGRCVEVRSVCFCGNSKMKAVSKGRLKGNSRGTTSFVSCDPIYPFWKFCVTTSNAKRDNSDAKPLSEHRAQ